MRIEKEELIAFLTAAAAKHAGGDWAKEYAHDAAEKFGVDENQFARQLEAAKQAHHLYEQSLGVTDENWAKWYALYLLDGM